MTFVYYSSILIRLFECWDHCFTMTFSLVPNNNDGDNESESESHSVVSDSL